MLTLTSPWSPPIGETMKGHLIKDLEEGCLSLGCVADAGLFLYQVSTGHELVRASKVNPAERSYATEKRPGSNSRAATNTRALSQK
jgi:hypothetical protein